MDKLKEICESRLKQVEENKSLYPEALLRKSVYFDSDVVSLERYLKRKDKSGIIAEFKRKSPSKGMIDAYADVKETTISYMQAGASALSVLTEPSYFGGKDSDLTEARKANYCPILRKDFILDGYQLVEARSIGADAILLIAAVLDKSALQHLSDAAIDLGLEVLIEIHSEDELDKLPDSKFVLGVNNRNLKSMTVDLETSLSIIDKVKGSFTCVSESGIKSGKDMAKLRTAGFDGFLIGEAFMNSPIPGKRVEEFIIEMHHSA